MDLADFPFADLMSEAGVALHRELARAFIEDDARRCEGSLYHYLRESWPVFDPSEFTHGWHLEAIAEHLEAVCRGQIRRLLVNVMPRSSKTSLVSIAWPTWIWAQHPDPDYPLIGPGVRFLCASYGANKAQQDGVTARRLIASNWYQQRWGHRVRVTAHRDNQEQYDTEAGGSRISTGIPESLGKGGIIKIIDDPHKVDEVESEQVIQSQIRAYNEVWRTRSNDPNAGAEVIIMQRIGEGDLAGYLLEHDDDIVHLCLPTLSESDRRCVTVIGFEDPREEDDIPLWPERFDYEWCVKQRKAIGEFAWASQFAQIPAPRGGGIVKREHWQIWPPVGEEHKWLETIQTATGTQQAIAYPPFDTTVAYLDTAFTEKQENAYSACISFGVFEGADGRPKVMMDSAWRARCSLQELVMRVMATCRRRKVDTLVIENKAGGVWVKQEIVRLTREGEFRVVLDDPKGDKVARLHSVTPLFESKLVYAPDRDWSDMVIQEVSSFPKGRYKDLTDCCSGALGYLRRSNLIRLQREYDEDERESRVWRGNRGSVAERYGV